MIHLKFGLSKFVRLHVCPNHRGKMRHCRLKTSHHDNILQTTKYLLYCLVRRNYRCQEIAFSGHQEIENVLKGALNN